ncbi:hypothetical protein [Porphyromonas sp.]
MPTIVLNESHAAKSFSEGNIIHETEMKRAQDWIDSQLAEVDSLGKNPPYSAEVQARTITILGSRGSGKTSFMRSLMTRYQEKGVQIIQLIDPTLIEEKGHPFLIILSELNRLVRAQLDKEDNVSRRPTASREACWERALEKLAEGLPSLEPIGTNYAQWEDAEYVLEKGLSRVASARGLAENFHALLGLALDILDKRAFLIALDDIDIDFLKGWPVLETLRRYLQTPLLITLLSGDLRLYSKAIRKQQWKNFGKALLKNEAEGLQRMADYDALVTDMEGQYLQKVIPSLYRIHLGSLQEKRQRPGGIQDIKVSSDEENTQPAEPIEDLYRDRLVRLGIGNRSSQEPYLSFLLSLPLRTQIRLLSALENPGRYGGETPWLDILLSELYVLRVDVDLIRSAPASLLQEMLRYLQRHELLGRAYLFQPSLQSAKYDAGLFALSTTYAQYSSQAPYLFFEYLIRIGLPYLLDADNLLADSTKSGAPTRYFSLETLLDYALAPGQSLTDACGSITAYLYALDEGAGTRRAAEAFRNGLGVLGLKGLASVGRRSGAVNEDRIDHVLRDEDPYIRNVAYLPVTIARGQRKQGTNPSASFYRLLAAIGELLKKYKLELEGRADVDEAEGVQRIASWLRERGALSSYTIPDPRNARSSQVGPDDSEEENEGAGGPVTGRAQELLTALYRWLRDFPRDLAFPPHLVGRIVSRLQRGQMDIPRTNLGEWMHRNVILFFNAVLIEVNAEEASPVGLNKNNATGGDKIFLDNLRKYPNEAAIPELARWMFRCPLLCVFLDPNVPFTLQNEDSVVSAHRFLFNPLSKVLPSGDDSSNTEEVAGVMTDNHEVEGLIDMTKGEVLWPNMDTLFSRLEREGIRLVPPEFNTSPDLKRLPFVDWGGAFKYKRMQTVWDQYRSRHPEILDETQGEGVLREGEAGA